MIPIRVKKVDVLGIKIDAITMPEALNKVEELARDKEGHYIVTPNPEFVMQSLKDGGFREIVNKADLAFADGVGILWAAKYLSIPLIKFKPLIKFQAWMQLFFSGIGIVLFPKTLTSVIPERITGVDMVWEISKLSSKRDFSIFLLGAAPGVAYETSRKLQLLYPKLQIADVMAGPPHESENQVINRIKQVKPNFIFLAFPAKDQLLWMQKYAKELSAVIMGIGGAFDFIAEATALNAPDNDKSKAKRAPMFLQKRGLEWLWRYFTQPWRKTRIKIATIDFIKTVMAYKLAQYK